MRAARERAIDGDGPTLIETKVYRFTPHSSDDDDRMYRGREEVAEALARDPIPAFGRRFQRARASSTRSRPRLQEEIATEVDEAVDSADASPQPSAADLLTHVFADGREDVSPMAVKTCYKRSTMLSTKSMARDEKVIVLGQDVGLRGGVFRVTEGLIRPLRRRLAIMDTPLTESAIIGVAIGASMAGTGRSPRFNSPISSGRRWIRSSARRPGCATARTAPGAARW